MSHDNNERRRYFSRANRIGNALAQDDDLFSQAVEQETEHAAGYVAARLAESSHPLAVLPGIAGAAAQQVGMAVNDGYEQESLTDLHGAFADQAVSRPISDRTAPYDIWRDHAVEEHRQALVYLEARIKAAAAPWTVLFGMLGAVGQVAGRIDQDGIEYSMVDEIRRVIDSFFECGREDRRGLKPGMPGKN